MSDRLEMSDWRRFMPEAYDWLGKVKVDTGNSPKENAWHVVGAVKNDNAMTIDAPGLDNETRTKLAAESEKMGWKGKGSPLRVALDRKFFLIVNACVLDTTSAQKARQLGMEAAAELKEITCKEVVLYPAKDYSTLDLLEGFASSFYDMAIFKTGQKKANEWPDKITLAQDGVTSDAIKERLSLCKALVFTRLLQDAPANWANPEQLARIMSDALQGSKAKCTIYGREDLKKMGAGAFISVAAGSEAEPQMICVEIPGKNTSQTVALVGKGVTFDSGGISIKPSAGMQDMKYDMSGAAAVMGAAMYLNEVQPPVNVVCIVGAVENLPSGAATKPGDVVQSLNGKTIEVHNTDAEGRLVLCDCLAFATTKFKPMLVLDIATLTGAVWAALGHAGAAYMTTKDKTASFVEKIASASGEPVWRLPLWPELAKETKGDVADLKNIAKSNVMAGTIMGGHFLKEFIDDTKTEWAHIDIAGTGWSCSATGFPSTGGSGFGVRTLIRACQEMGK